MHSAARNSVRPGIGGKHVPPQPARQARYRFLSLLVLYLSGALLAQTNAGSISGTVTDPDGAVVSGARVTLISDGTSASRTLTSDDHGNFVISAVPAGVYRLTVELTGFEKHESLNISMDLRSTMSPIAPARSANTTNGEAEAV